ATASEMTLALLLHTARAERLIQQHSLNNKIPGLDQVLEDLINQTIKTGNKNEYESGVQNAINFVVFKHLLNLAVNKNATPMVRAITNNKIDDLASWLNGKKDAFSKEMYRSIKRFRDKPEEFSFEVNIPKIPDGSPIGAK
ncbi:MAG: peptidase, partial [Christiangramia sp.]|nr:peptidase [Christiangramia sp.]